MDDTRISSADPRCSQIKRPGVIRCGVARQIVAAAILSSTIGLTSSGCAGRSMSLASINPFQNETSETAAAPPSMLGADTKPAGESQGMMAKTASTVGGWFGRGDKQAGDPNDPLSLANNPEKLEPDVFVANGQLWESTGNLTKAMESYAKALEADPKNGPALTSIARLHFREGRFPQSAEFFQKAIAQDPKDAALYNDLGLTLSKLDQHKMAAQTLQRALELAPGTSRYANNLASVYFESGQSDEALKVLTANNKPAVAHFNMAFLHYKKGQTTEAQTQLTQSLSYEQQASADPATKRAINRSREMLAQLNPGQSQPSATPDTPGMPRDIGPAVGPAASIAANPAHRPSNAKPQVLGQFTPSTGVLEGTPVSYQDPRSYMSPQLPPEATAPGPQAQPARQPGSVPSASQPPASTVPPQKATPAAPQAATPKATPPTASPASPPGTKPAQTPASASQFTLPSGIYPPTP